MKEEITINGKQIILIGTAHISKDSITEVEQVIREEKPDSVCVELCSSRYESVRNADHWKNMNIVKVIKEGKAPVLMVNLILSAFQKKLGDQLGVKPGAEMIAAINVTQEIGAKTVLADRDVTITLKRAWRNLSFWGKNKLLYQILGGLFDAPEISEKEIEELKKGDMLTQAIETMAKELPSLKKVLIDERDLYLAAKISEAPGEKIVAVVGAGHVPGIVKQMGKPVDLAELETIPPPGKVGKIIKWAIPAFILALFVYGFFMIDAAISLEMIKRWVLVCGTMAALGALIAGGHILSILVAFIAAPITTLHPALAAGWFSGLAEAWVRKPKVSDFENLPKDITTFKGFRKNEITKILMVVVLSNVGAMIGMLIGIPMITHLLI